jgi:hypothetical protein
MLDVLPTNIDVLCSWLQRDLRCILGKREFSNGRYFVAEIHDASSMATAYEAFLIALRRKETVAGLFVISNAIALPQSSSAMSQFHQCAEFMRDVSDVSPDWLADGGRLAKSVELECPVTGIMRVFDDFDAVAFCPQSLNINDPLYDPMMGAPVPCVNFNSDIYAFSMFTRDLSLRMKGAELYELASPDRCEIFDQASRRWQQYALATIQGYMSITDLKKCPISLADEESIWFANHRDPSFAERTKSQFSHHMPKLYAPKIVTVWERYFDTGQFDDMPMESITPFGHAQYQRGAFTS